MKLKIYSLLMIAFMLIASSITMVNADINSTNKSQISITKTVKVNKTYKIKKLLKAMVIMLITILLNQATRKLPRFQRKVLLPV